MAAEAVRDLSSDTALGRYALTTEGKSRTAEAAVH